MPTTVLELSTTVLTNYQADISGTYDDTCVN